MVEAWKDIQEFIREGGWLAILILVLALGNKKIWVWGWLYLQEVADRKKAEAQRDYWMNKCFSMLGLTKEAVSSGEEFKITLERDRSS